jgi:sec-independent protein translocase protein TatB
MFDIGFWEIILVGIVALLVVGPDKFPGLIKESARWAARARRFIMDTKRDLEREIKFDDIEKDLTARVRGLDQQAGPAPRSQPPPGEKQALDKQSTA